MRLAISLFAALVVHGIALGVTAAAVRPPKPAPRMDPLAVEVEVDVTAPRPDPVADAAKTPADTSPSRASPPPEPIRRSTLVPALPREVVRVTDPARVDVAPAGIEPVADSPSAAVTSSVPTPSSPSSVSSQHAAPAPVPTPAPGVVASAKPRYRSNPAPDYPIPSRRRQEEGVVLLNVVVRPDGVPAAVSLNRTSGYPLLDRAALDAVNHWTFDPARAAGVPISSTLLIPIRFSLSSTQ
jgi:protein TonB